MTLNKLVNLFKMCKWAWGVKIVKTLIGSVASNRLWWCFSLVIDAHGLSPTLACSHTQECAGEGKFFSLEEHSPPLHHRNAPPWAPTLHANNCRMPECSEDLNLCFDKGVWSWPKKQQRGENKNTTECYMLETPKSIALKYLHCNKTFKNTLAT